MLGALLCVASAGALFGRKPQPPPVPTTITPSAVDASHLVRGFGPECACDGNDKTFWLVPGGQRMEMMSRDKWIVLDLGEDARPVRAMSLLGVVNSFGAARVVLEAGESADGPWQHVQRFRALGSPMRWQRIDLSAGNGEPLNSRFYRIFVRREGHATFRHQVHGVKFHVAEEAEEGS
jgi:hypothetical protein